MQSRSTLYILDADNNLMPAADAVEWAFWMAQHQDRLQIGDWRRDGVRISTVFTGEERPFETMIWGGPFDKRVWFYTSYGDALEGHVAIVRRLVLGELN